MGQAGRVTATGSAIVLAIAVAGHAPAFGREAASSPASSAPASLRVAGAVSAHASIAAAGSRVVVTWAATPPGSPADIFAAFSGDGGASFGAPVRVNDVPGDARVSGEQAPRVALGDGVQVVWATRQAGTSLVRSARAGPGESVFAPATTVHAEKLPGARGWASLALDGRGTAHVAWLDGRGDGASSSSTLEGGGRATARRAMRQDLYQAAWRADGSHDEARVATDVCFCCKTSVAGGPDESVYVAWRHIYKPNLRDIAVARSTDGGRTFGAAVRVSEDRWAIDGCPDDGPAIAVGAQGVVHVAWPTLVSETAGKGIFYSYSADGGRSFVPRTRIDGEAGGAAHPQIAVAGERVLVAWDQARGDGTRGVLVREIAGTPGSPVWAPRMAAPALLGGDGSYPSVAATAAGAVVAWTEGASSGSEIRVQRVP